jgi:hypothetical protein
MTVAGKTLMELCFNLLLDVNTMDNLLDKLGRVYNMDDSGFQMNPRPEAVIAEIDFLTLYYTK